MIDLNKLAKNFVDDELDSETYTVVENGDWIEDGKYSFKETIIKYQGKFYSISEARSGSYYSDYYYNEPEAYEVEPYEITVTKYRVVK